jgi:hypothetical protein
MYSCAGVKYTYPYKAWAWLLFWYIISAYSPYYHSSSVRFTVSWNVAMCFGFLIYVCIYDYTSCSVSQAVACCILSNWNFSLHQVLNWDHFCCQRLLFFKGKVRESRPCA